MSTDGVSGVRNFKCLCSATLCCVSRLISLISWLLFKVSICGELQALFLSLVFVFNFFIAISLLLPVDLICCKSIFYFLMCGFVYVLVLLCVGVLVICVLVFTVFYIALLYTIVAGLLAKGQYPEGPATGHLGTHFLGFPVSAYKRMLRPFPRLQVATACYSCSPPDFKFLARFS